MPDLGVSLDLWPWVWLVIAVAFLLLELTVLGGSFMVLPFGVSALLASLLGFSGVGVGVQWSTFVLGGGLLFLLFWRYQSLVQRGNELPPGVGAVRLVGLTGMVTEPIDPTDAAGRGRIVVDGEDWGAMAAEGTAVLPAGTRVRITDVQGTRVLVVPVDPAADPPPPDPPDATDPTRP